MKNFAELKRTIKPGMTLKVVQHDYRPELTGTTRVVTDVQGNGYFFRMNGEGNRFWSGYAKAHCYSFPDANTYRQDEGCKCSCGCIVNDAPDTYHSEGCNIRIGKRFAWTIQIVEQDVVTQ
jgi:hypothetical protein